MFYRDVLRPTKDSDQFVYAGIEFCICFWFSCAEIILEIIHSWGFILNFGLWSVQALKWFQPQNDPQPWNDPQIAHKKIPISRLVYPEMIPKEFEQRLNMGLCIAFFVLCWHVAMMSSFLFLFIFYSDLWSFK